MTEDEMFLFLGLHGFYCVKSLRGIALYFAVMDTLKQLTEEQLESSLSDFRGLDDNSLAVRSDFVENHRRIIENLENN